MAQWPSSLPDPSFRGYGFKVKGQIQRTPMDAGDPKQRLRYRQTLDIFPVSWEMTSAQLDAFESFYKDDINNGCSYFDIYLYDGSGRQLMEARFIAGKYEVRPISRAATHWTISAQLEVRGR